MLHALKQQVTGISNASVLRGHDGQYLVTSYIYSY